MKLVKAYLVCFCRHYRQATKAAFLTIFFIFGVVLVSSCQPPLKASLQTPLLQDSGIKVYFNQNLSSQYQDPYRNFIRQGDNLEQQIIDAINQAQSSVDLAVMEFRLPQVAEALKLAQQRQVKVRLLIDNQYNKTLADYTPQDVAQMNRHDKLAFAQLQQYPADALAMLRVSGIEIKDDTSDGATKGTGLMHHKFVVTDGKTTIISSANLTVSDMHGDFGSSESRGNPNNMVVIPDNPQLALIFTDEFNYMWQGLFKSHKPYRTPVTVSVGTGSITVNFSPASKKQDMSMTSNGIIANLVQQASSSVHIAVFVYSDQKISDTLGVVHDQGVEDIKVLIDQDFFSKSYSKAYDALGVCPRGKKVHPWHKPITTVGYPTSLAGDRGVHSKMAILDGVVAIAGSHNWSNSANYSNDETLIVINNPTVAAHYEREFSRLYRTAKLGLDTLPSAQKCLN